MKTLILIAVTFLAANQALADGFLCRTSDNTLNVKVYDHVQSNKGTRSAAVLVLSNPLANEGEHTIARFTAEQNTLENSGASFAANVDLRHVNDLNKTALLADKVAVEDVNTLELKVAFNYDAPVASGVGMDGVLLINTRTGSHERIVLDCVRYLKAE